MSTATKEQTIDKMRRLTAAQGTDVLVASMIALGDPAGNSAERIALTMIYSELETRHNLTDALDDLFMADDPADCPETYTDAMLIALTQAKAI